MTPGNFVIVIGLFSDDGPTPVLRYLEHQSEHSITGTYTLPLSASDDADNEENAVRLAEQMVRESFKKAREKCVSS